MTVRMVVVVAAVVAVVLAVVAVGFWSWRSDVRGARSPDPPGHVVASDEPAFCGRPFGAGHGLSGLDRRCQSAGPRPVTVLLLPGFGPEGTELPGLGPAEEFPLPEPGPLASFVRLAGATARHRLFAERMIEQGRTQAASSVPPGVRLPFDGGRTQVWAPRLGPLREPEPGRWVLRPSRAARARMEVAACPGELAWTPHRGGRRVTVRLVGCGEPLLLEFGVPVGIPGPAGRIEPDPQPSLALGEVGTWVWEDQGRLWSVSLGLLRVEPGRVFWHREGPVPDAVYGPADWIALRDAQLDVRMQAGFVRGAQRALFAAVASRPASWNLVMVHPLADLALALAQAPGSWNDDLRGRALAETMDFARDRISAGHRVVLAGFGPVAPVTRLVPESVLEGLAAEAMVPAQTSVLFLWERPDAGARRALEAGLSARGLTASTGFLLSRVPGGLRLDLPPGTAMGRCRRGRRACEPPDFRGHWPSAPWLRGWFRLPEELGVAPEPDLARLLPHVMKMDADRKQPCIYNQ